VVWNAVQGRVTKYNHWPNPFKTLLKKLDVLACENRMQFAFDYVVTAFAAWAWSAFIPSPVELTRKFLSGSYKCGFYMQHGIGSPFDIIWEDKSVSRALAEITGPFVGVLNYMWMMDTAFSALQTYSSIVYFFETCAGDRYETLLRDAGAPLPPGIHNGGPVSAQLIWDPANHASLPSNSVSWLERSNIHATAFGYLKSNNHVVNSARIKLTIGIEEVAYLDIGHMGIDEIVPYKLEYADAHDAGAIKVEISYDIEAGGITNSSIECTRFTVRQTPIDIPNGGPLGGKEPPPSSRSPCSFLSDFYDSM